jgi:hypothetical protein
MGIMPSMPQFLGGTPNNEPTLQDIEGERNFERERQGLGSLYNPADDRLFFEKQKEDEGMDRWTQDLSDVNAELYLLILGYELNRQTGEYKQVRQPLCTPEFLDMLKPYITIATSKSHMNTNYDDERFKWTMLDLSVNIQELCKRNCRTSGIPLRSSNINAFVDMIRLHCQTVAQRGIDDKERRHRHSNTKISEIRTQQMNNQGTGGWFGSKAKQ